MAAVPCTVTGCGRFIELGDLPLQRDGLGTDNLILCLFKDLGVATQSILRECVNYQEMLDEGAVPCDFSGYSPKILGPADKTISYVTTGTPRKAQLNVNTQIWNPAGGVTNNTPVLSVLLYRRTTATALSACLPLGICDTSGGSASGGSYTHTFGTLTSQAA